MTAVLLSRRTLLSAAGLSTAALGTVALAQANPPQGRSWPTSWPAAGPDLAGTPAAPVAIPSAPEPQGIISDASFPLWPEGQMPDAAHTEAERLVLERGAPGGHDRAILHVNQPILEVFRPAVPNGAAVIIAPGGGYFRLAIDKEGAAPARRLNQSGVTAFVLNYRLPADGWASGYDAPVQDIQRAIRLVRARAATWNLDVARIGVMGFSAGGNLAAAAVTRFDDQVYAAVDAADGLSARPDFACLCYAAMSMGNRPQGDARPGDLRPLDQRVRSGLPPVFLVHAADDDTVPVSHSLDMFTACKAAGVPVEMHVYQEGGHGFGLTLPDDRPASHWPDAFDTWARRTGIFG